MKNLVFVVEDNPTQQKMLQVHLEEMLGSYEVRAFTNPEDMMSHLGEKPFAIVLDHYFDGQKTGMHYLEILRKKYKSIPVIYYTSAEDPKIKEEALNKGVEQFISKDAASLVRLRTALDGIGAKKSKKGFFQKLFGN